MLMNAKILLIGTILLAFGLLLLLLFLIMLVRRISYYSQTHKVKRAPMGVSYLAIFTAVILLAFSLAFFNFSNDLKWFSPYKPDAKACLVDITRTNDPVKTLRVIMYSSKGDSLKENPEFYLSGDAWYIKGQLVRVSGFIGKLFPVSHAYKINEMYGEYATRNSITADKTIFAHRVIDEGAVDLGQYVKFIKLINGSFQASEFSTPPILARDHDRYWLTISDSGQVSVEMAE
jgi:hypothetical protein